MQHVIRSQPLYCSTGYAPILIHAVYVDIFWGRWWHCAPLELDQLRGLSTRPNAIHGSLEGAPHVEEASTGERFCPFDSVVLT